LAVSAALIARETWITCTASTAAYALTNAPPIAFGVRRPIRRVAASVK